MERKETRELDAKIRRRWAEWESRIADRMPLSEACGRWEAHAAGVAARLGQQLIKGIVPPTREREVPPDLHAELNEVTPQALLRDLHRPTGQFQITEYDRVETGWDRGGRGGVQVIKEALAARYEVPIKALLHTPSDVREDLTELRRILDLKWEEAPKLGVGAATTSSAGVDEVPSFQDEMNAERGIK